MSCACTPDALADECGYTLACLTGVAKRRADSYASRASGFPTAADIRQAAGKGVADLATCERVRTELADIFASWATVQLAARSLRPGR